METPTKMEDELVGIWSVDHMYGPGAQSDELLVFKQDGTGRLDFINFVLCTAYEFSWTVTSPNHLTLVGTKTHQISEDGKTVEESEDTLNLRDFPFQIATEETPSGNAMRVLRIKMMGGLSDHFGFVREDIKGFEKPRFD